MAVSNVPAPGRRSLQATLVLVTLLVIAGARAAPARAIAGPVGPRPVTTAGQDETSEGAGRAATPGGKLDPSAVAAVAVPSIAFGVLLAGRGRVSRWRAVHRFRAQLRNYDATRFRRRRGPGRG